MVKENRLHFAGRRMLRRGLRWVLGHSPETIRNLAHKVPYSRFHKCLTLVSGPEIVKWHNVKIEANPGYEQEYYLYFFGSYGEPEIDNLINTCTDSDVFFDVGANCGLISLAIAQACPHLTIYAFEPDSTAIRRFKANLRRNPHLSARIHLIEKAVSDTDGEAVFLTSSGTQNPEAGRLAQPAEHISGVEIPTLRLDTFCKGISVLPQTMKIDVEGAEIEVLRGCESLLGGSQKMSLFLETHGLNYGSQKDEFNANLLVELKRYPLEISRLQEAGYSLLAEDEDLGGHSHLFITLH